MGSLQFVKLIRWVNSNSIKKHYNIRTNHVEIIYVRKIKCVIETLRHFTFWRLSIKSAEKGRKKCE